MDSRDAIFLLKLIAAEASDYDGYEIQEIEQRSRDVLAQVANEAIVSLEMCASDTHREYFPCPPCEIRKDMQ